jgi:quercetin dioxygenase-like cupin family protein
MIGRWKSGIRCVTFRPQETPLSKSTVLGLVFTIGVAVLPAAIGGTGHVSDEAAAAAPHQCVLVTPDEIRPEFGCFRIGASKGMTFDRPAVYWHLRTYPDRLAADAAKSPSGLVSEQDGHVWVSEFGSNERTPPGGHPVVVVGPLTVIPGMRYDAEIAYSVMAPNDHSRVHTHSGPEAWYVLAGTQCLETPDGASRVREGGTMTAAPNGPMELSVTGTDVARALTLVIHDSAQEFGAASDWKPPGACRLQAR